MDSFADRTWTEKPLRLYLYNKFDANNTASNTEKLKGKGHGEKAKQLTRAIHEALPFWRDYRTIVGRLFTFAKCDASGISTIAGKQISYLQSYAPVFKLLGKFEAGVELRVRANLASLQSSLQELDRYNQSMSILSLRVELGALSKSGDPRDICIDDQIRHNWAQEMQGGIIENAKLANLKSQILLYHDRLSLEASIQYVIENGLRKLVQGNGFVGSEIDDFVGATEITNLLKILRPDPGKAIDEAVTYMVGLLLAEVTTEQYNDELKDLIAGERVPPKPSQYRGGNEYTDRSKQIRRDASWR